MTFTKREFSEYYTKYFPQVHGYLKRRVSPDLAQDITQDAFVKAWKARESFKSGTNFRAWIFRIANNTYINQRRRYFRLREIAEKGELQNLTAKAGLNQEEKLVRLDLEHKLHKFIDTHVPLAHRETIKLIDLQDHSYQEAADVQDVAVGTIMSRTYRARQALRQHKDKLEKLVA